MPHELENVPELYRVGSIRFHERLVRLENRPLLLLVVHFLLHRLMKFQVLRLAGLIRGGAFHTEELIKSEAAQEPTVTVIDVDRAKPSLTEFPKPKSHPGESPHEGRIHLLAIAEIDDKIPIPALDHLFHKFFETRAILEGSATFYLYPDGAVNAADLDRRCRVHTIGRNYPTRATAVKSLPASSPHKGLPEGDDSTIDDKKNPPGGDTAMLKVLVPRGGELRPVRAFRLRIVALCRHDIIA
jgi:hypothetical protein